MHLTSSALRFSALLGAASVICAAQPAPPAPHDSSGAGARLELPGSPLGIAWGLVYGYSGVPAEEFVPTIRELGGGFSKVYLFWQQLEPRPGEFDFRVLDAYLEQLRAPEEGLVSIFSTSTWATATPSSMLPPSPARDLETYYRMVHAAVSHARGRVRYWQNDCEPNSPVYWAGTKEEFVAQLKVFHRAVKDADPGAVVVVGGYDGLFNPPGQWEFPGQKAGLEFFDYVIREGGAHFDLFDLRLYADPYTIGPRVAHMRARMVAAGFERPIICTEYNGPGFFELRANHAHFALVGKWGAAASLPEGPGRDQQAEEIRQEIAALHDNMSALPPETQMFLQGCPAELEAKLRRLQGRDLVYRNVLALAAGVQKMLYWDLWHDTSARDDMMTVMYGKLKFMERSAHGLQSCNPTTEVFRRLAAALRGMTAIHRLPVEMPGLMLFQVERRDLPALLIAWERRDPFAGDEQPPTTASWSAPSAPARAQDAFGLPVDVRHSDGRMEAELTSTPVFIELTP